MKIDKNHIDRIERGIAPPHRLAITLPTDHKGVVIYVAIGAFTPELSQEEEENALVEVAEALRLKVHKAPTMTPLPEYGDHMTFEDFVESVNGGSFDDDDGHGDLATIDQCSTKTIYPSDVAGEQALADYKRPAWATHVVWYNK